MAETSTQSEGRPSLPMAGVPQPTREEVLKLPRVHISSHPVMAHKMTALRHKNTSPPEFYRLVKEIGALLAYEATISLAVEPIIVETPLGPAPGQQLAGGIGVMPILRAGLGLAEAFREVIPDIQVWHLGLRRNEHTLQAMEYYNRLPHKVDLQVAYAIDPMLATGGSAIDAINVLKRRGIPRLSYVCIIAAPYGLLKLAQTHPDIDIYVAALDESLNDYGFILPGLRYSNTYFICHRVGISLQLQAGNPFAGSYNPNGRMLVFTTYIHYPQSVIQHTSRGGRS